MGSPTWLLRCKDSTTPCTTGCAPVPLTEMQGLPTPLVATGCCVQTELRGCCETSGDFVLTAGCPLATRCYMGQTLGSEATATPRPQVEAFVRYMELDNPPAIRNKLGKSGKNPDGSTAPPNANNSSRGGARVDDRNHEPSSKQIAQVRV